MIYNQSILTVEISRRAIALNKPNRKEGSGASFSFDELFARARNVPDKLD